MGVCVTANLVDITPMGRDTLYSSFAIARKRAVFSSLSFPKEKVTKKKENLRACALKNPSDCTGLLRSIKNGMLVFAVIAGRASHDEIVRNGNKNKKWGRLSVVRPCGERLPRLRRAVAVKLNSDGRNSISHYPDCVDTANSWCRRRHAEKLTKPSQSGGHFVVS